MHTLRHICYENIANSPYLLKSDDLESCLILFLQSVLLGCSPKQTNSNISYLHKDSAVVASYDLFDCRFDNGIIYVNLTTSCIKYFIRSISIGVTVLFSISVSMTDMSSESFIGLKAS